MNKINNKTCFYVMCCMFLVSACSHTDHLDQHSILAEEGKIPTNNNKETFVSLEQATEVAGNFFNQKSGETNLRSAKSHKKVASSKTIKDKNNSLAYVLNYQNGGFAIVSATRNYYPILAYSDDNSFELTSDMGPVAYWLEDMEDAIKSSAMSDDSIKQNMRIAWESYEKDEVQVPTDTAEVQATQGTTLRAAIIYPCMAEAFGNRMQQDFLTYGPQGWTSFYPLSSAGGYFDSYEYNNLCNMANSYESPPQYTIVILKTVVTTQKVDTLITTLWDQEKPFNSVCCSSDDPAGCASVAMAQIMKFYKRPNPLIYKGRTLNWNNMPNTESYVTTTTSDSPYLIAWAHDASHTHHNFEQAWALPEDVEDGLQSGGYTVKRKSYNYDDVRKEILTNKRPVLMLGSTNVTLEGGHYWVCDGCEDNVHNTVYFIEFITPNCFYGSYTYYSPTIPGICNTFHSSYLHMNWGWRYKYNGWYYYDNVNTGNGNFQHFRETYFIN